MNKFKLLVVFFVGVFFAVKGQMSSSASFSSVPYNKGGFCFNKADTIKQAGGLNSARAIAVDFDGDGYKDLIVSSLGFVKIFLNDKFGKFKFVQSHFISISGVIKDFCVGNFDGDSKIDLAVADGTAQIHIFTNTSTLSNVSTAFFGIVATPASLIDVKKIEAHDMDDDGLDDIAVVGNFGTRDCLFMMKRISANVFVPKDTIHVFNNSGGNADFILKVADINNDLRFEVILADRTTSGKVLVFQNTVSSATATPFFVKTPGTYTFTGKPEDFKIIDLNNDFKKDIAILTQSNGIIIQNGTGSTLPFTGPIITYTNQAAKGNVLCITDLNLDGFKDLSIVDKNRDTLKVISGIPNSPFFSNNINSVTVPSRSAAIHYSDFIIADLNNDYYEDFFLYDNYISSNYPAILLNQSYTPTLSVTGSTAICAGQTTTLAVRTPTFISSSINFTYLWAPNSTTSTNTQSLVVNAPNSYSAAITYTIINGGACTMSVIPITIGTPTIPINVNGSFVPVCAGAKLPFFVSGATTYTLFSVPIMTLTTSTPSTPGFFDFVAPSASTILTLVGNDNGCVGTASINIIVKPSPFLLGTSDKTVAVCYGDYSDIIIKPNVLCTFSWSPGGMDNDTINIGPVVSPTTYMVVFTDLISGCVGRDSVIISIHSLPVISYSVIPEKICAGKSGTLIAYGDATTYYWSSAFGPVTFFASAPFGTYYDTLIGENLQGCRTKMLIALNVSDKCSDVIAYNIVTPNGDKLNDWFVIDNIENYKNNVVMIYNRWGQMIAEINHYNNTSNFWTGNDKYLDGKHFEQDVPPGTYFFTINLGDNSALIKGYIELIKK